MSARKQAKSPQKACTMIRYTSNNQLPLAGFETPFETTLDNNNRWVKFAPCIPWDELAEAYYSSLHHCHGRPAKDARLVIGAVIIKHKLCLSDEETIEQIRENAPFRKKPRTYREEARKAYLAIVKRRRSGKKLYRKGNKQQLQYRRRNFNHIEKMLDSLAGKANPLSHKRLRQYWIIQTLFAQQEMMWQNKSHRCDDRIVSISQEIHYAGKPLGRPKKETEENKTQLKREKRQRHEDYTQRIPIEGKFGQGKNAYGLNKIKAKTARTSYAWINSCFFVMNLLVLAKVFHLPGIMQRLYEILRVLPRNKLGKWFYRAFYQPVNCATDYCGA